MSLFNKKTKIDNDRAIIDKMQFELLNNSNIDEDRQVLANVKFPYNDKLEHIDLILICKKGIFIIKPLTVVGEYIGGQFETVWSVNGIKQLNPIQTVNGLCLGLKSFLKVNSKDVIPYIALNNSSTIRDIPMINKKYRIVKECDLYYFLGLHISLLPDKFTDEDISNFKKKLNKSNIIQELYNS